MAALCFRIICFCMISGLITASVDSSISEQELQAVLRNIGTSYFSQEKKSESGCKCVGYNCGCCADLDIPDLHIKDTGCVNVSYLPNDYGFRVTLIIDNVVLINMTVSARNPPPICVGIPYLEKEASICLDIYNLDVSNKTFSGCVKLEARLLHILVESVDFGCFHIPLVGKKSIESAIDLVEGIKAAKAGIYAGAK